MKKYLNYALLYAIAAMVGGVFYREFTKWNGFSGVTALGKVHTHLFLLGTVLFLLIALFSEKYDLEGQKKFRLFLRLYNLGLPLMVGLMVVRGILQVLGTPLSGSANGAISGIAGIGHALTGVGLVLFLLALRSCEGERS